MMTHFLPRLFRDVELANLLHVDEQSKRTSSVRGSIHILWFRRVTTYNSVLLPVL